MDEYFKKIQEGFTPGSVFSGIKSALSPVTPSAESIPKPTIQPPTVIDPMNPPKPAYTVKPQTWGDLGNLIADFTYRAPARATASLIGKNEIKPETGAEKLLFGEKPIQSVKAQYESGKQTLTKLGVPASVAAPLSFLGVGSLEAIDLIPGIPGKNIAKKLAVETSETVVRNILEKEVKKLAPESIDRIVPLITRETNPSKIKEIINTEAKTALQSAKASEEITKPASSEIQKTSTLGSQEDAIAKEAQKVSETVSKPDISINTKRYEIGESAKNLIADETERLRPQIEEAIGKPLSNIEVRQVADQSSKVLEEVIGRKQTREYIAALQRTRDRLAAAAQSNTVDENFIKDLLVVRTNAANAGRLLQAHKVATVAVDAKTAIIDAVLKVNQNVDEVAKAAQGVDFSDFKQASEFYRKFIQPKLSEWIDLLRYNSMLSSPITHEKNIFSNLLNTTLIPVVEKATNGAFDFITSKFTGAERQTFSGEAVKYLQGYAKNIKPAWQKFVDVFKGKSPMTQLDLEKEIPIADTGLKGRIVKVLSVPMKALEGADQFFRELTTAGETEALKYRRSLGGKVATVEGVVPIAEEQIASTASDIAAYRLYRQDLFHEGQGPVLDAVDQLTSKLMSLRNNPNPIISIPAKFTVPFVKTPMNIFKQGLEYSPIGFATAIGNADKRLQFAKATMGSAVVAGTAMLIGAGRLTGAEPRTEPEKSMWRKAGRQPYSIKIGDKWVSYQYLNPAIAFNMAMVSIVDQMIKDKKTDQDFADVALSAVSNYAAYLADQSYFKSFGDLLNAVSGGESAASQLISNYPQQLIPFRALGGWMARLSDDYQRKVDKDASFVEKQIQSLMMNVPGLTEMIPARTDAEGNPIENQNKLFNAFSPVKVMQEDPTLGKFLNDYQELRKGTSEQTAKDKKLKEDTKSKYDEIQALVKAGKTNEATRILNTLSDEEYKAYRSIRQSERTKSLNTEEVKLLDTYKEIQDLVSQGKRKEAQDMLGKLTDAQYKAYQGIKSKLQ